MKALEIPYGSCFVSEKDYTSIPPYFSGKVPVVYIREKEHATPKCWESDVDIHLDIKILAGDILELRMVFLLENPPKVYVVKVPNCIRFLERLTKTDYIVINFFDKEKKPHHHYFFPHHLGEKAKELLKRRREKNEVP